MKISDAQRKALRFLASVGSGVHPGMQINGQMIMPSTLWALAERKYARRTDVMFHSATDHPTYAITERGRAALDRMV